MFAPKYRRKVFYSEKREDNRDILRTQCQWKGYAQTYLRTIHNQLNANVNHAVKYYDLPKNLCIANKKMGKAKAKEMLSWTMEEYLKFSK